MLRFRDVGKGNKIGVPHIAKEADSMSTKLKPQSVASL